MTDFKWKKTALLSALLVLAMAISATACDSATSADSGEPAAAADDFDLQGDAEAGKSLYAAQCAACHGADGRGDGPGGRALTPSPTDFTAEALPAGQAYKAVKKGGMAVGKAATMPGFERTMSEEDLHNIVAYILSMSD